MLKNGIKGKEIAKMLGVSKGHVSNEAYEQNGINGYQAQANGKKKGDKRILNPNQEKEIIKLIAESDPMQLKFKECMWTRNNIRQLIKNRYEIDIKP